MNEERFTELVAAYLSGNISEKEKASLLNAIESSSDRKAIFDAFQEVWSLTEAEPLVFEADKSVGWKNIETRIDTSGQKLDSSAKIVRPSFGRQLLRIAAVFAVVAAGLWWYSTQQVQPQLVEWRTGDGEQKEVTLPDA
ncbi:MAG: hypothetical protein AAFO94_05725, partial [Bacteroidota bacterium]